ncbi:copia protein [Tanacetum coccineum]
MEHLPIHLAEEALLAGLVQYRWMCPIERCLLTLEMYVCNRARLEGCIAKGALMEECMTFCARRHLRSLQKLAPRERQRIHNKEFPSWFRADVLKQGAEKKVLTTEVIDMAMGLTNMAKRYNGYVVNGFRFRTKRMDNSRVTQNSDVVVIASTTSFSSRKDKNPMSMELTYYGKLTDIIEVRYTDETKFVLFKCNWVDNRTGVKVDNFGITSVNFSHLLYKDNNPTNEPFILASQAEQVISQQLDERRSIHVGEEMWVRHRVEGTFVEKRATQSPTIENQQQNNLVHVVESDSDEEMEDESEAHICDESEEEFDETIEIHPVLLKDTPLEDSSQELTRNNTTDALVQSSIASNGSGSSTSNDVRKKGRGPALGYQGKEKIKIIFNECMQPIGDSSTDLANLLGGIAKCEARAPFNIVSWKSMPDTNLDLMWRDVQTNAPEDYKDTCLKLIGGHWKKWKSIVKHDFFTPNKDDPEKLLTPPSDSRVNPEQWPDLVNYWQRDDVQMKAKNEDLCRANVFIKTRTANNGTIPDEDTRIVVEKLNEVPQSEQTDSFKEQVFIDLVGSDGHGSVKTFGGGVSSRKVFGPRSSLMNTTSSHAIERMVQAQVAAQLEAKVAERIANIVADQDAQIEAKVAAHVSNHEKAQMEWFKKLELLLGRELPPPPGYHAHRSGSSLVRDYNEDVFR